ncbi:hypothetical protein C7U61_14635 [Rhizobium sp. JAB6]|uniref:hypothetical protein n=1 Tax=Rhizobium sp. JAB6 TaxID=2127050 RepID=UPI000D1332C0|nr:hypothetical protein [Rhizobium sp. JAB6]PST19726.1 hypothetical protein C7U61_14635 [Rhizobium sp. JAB6]
MSVNSELNELLSDNAPAPEITADAPAPVNEQPAVARDDQGRFATKTPAEAPAPVVDQPVAATPTEQQPIPGNVPVGAVKAEREKRQAAEADAEALRREVAELRGMVVARQQPAPQPPKEERPIALWDDPDAYLQNQLTPFQQQMQEMREELWESKAAAVHTPEAVQAAKAAAEKLFGTPEGNALHQQITASGNPFDNLVKWHKQQQAIARVGDDPEAFIQAELERRLADPAEQAKILERIRSGAASNPTTAQPVTSLPPSLSRLPSGGNAAADNDMSDSALFSHATSGKR